MPVCGATYGTTFLTHIVTTESVWLDTRMKSWLRLWNWSGQLGGYHECRHPRDLKNREVGGSSFLYMPTCTRTRACAREEAGFIPPFRRLIDTRAWGDFPSTGKSSCFIDWLDPLSWLIQVELVLEAGQIRAGLLDKAFREWRILRSG